MTNDCSTKNYLVNLAYNLREFARGCCYGIYNLETALPQPKEMSISELEKILNDPRNIAD
jgi:hypothetical protein